MDQVTEYARKLARHGASRLDRALLSATARAVVDEHLTYLSVRKLRQLEKCLQAVNANGIPGGLLETGVALGGSAIVMASARGERDFDGYDVFGMIPAPGSNDRPEVHDRYQIIREGASRGIGDDTYYGYRDDLFDAVVAAFGRHGVPVSGNVRLHRGLFEDTLLPSAPLALVHIDCDWYGPVMLSLERIYGHLSEGGYVVCDDYFRYEGAKTAVDEFTAKHVDLRPVVANEHLILQRA